MLAAVYAVQMQNPSSVMIAVPVAPPTACEDLRRQVDRIVCAFTPEPFVAVGAWYEDFSQTTDAEVRRLLQLPTSRC